MAKAADIREITLQDGGHRVSVLTFGARMRGWWVPLGGGCVPVVLGYDDPAAYLSDPLFLGATIGRVANRIGGARFTLDGQEMQLAANEGENQLHGGATGLHNRLWDVVDEPTARSVRLSTVLPDGDEGYPGEARISVRFTLDAPRLVIELAAEVSRPGPINLTNHNYYNLMGDGPIWNHSLQVPASGYTPVDAALIPTGQVLPVEGTRYDYRQGTRLDAIDPDHTGSDINLALDPARDPKAPLARLSAPNGLALSIWSDAPGVQFYTGAGIGAASGAHPGQSFAPFRGLCLEPQGFPDAVNQPGFPPVIVTPDRPYRHSIVLEIAEDGQ
ncbi:aldose epimerase family protein [Nioella nitratireducens]|uniref:aldose epimerase family protein n=1 Tax=Nioella nitratireducens TaxID=1287720 RepID=UPI0008FD2232|nr:aldose epimerase family protein [Nioella nitratireducens]